MKFKPMEYYAINHPHLNFTYGKVSYVWGITDYSKGYIAVEVRNEIIRFTTEGKFYHTDALPALYPAKSILKYLYS